MGIPFYENALMLQQSIKNKALQVTNAIQTNAVLIDERWANFFKQNDFSVGISLDGPASVHDLKRRTLINRGSFFKVLNAVRLLKQNSLNFGALAVVTRQTLNVTPEDFLNFFNELDIDSVDLLPQEPNFLRKGKEFWHVGQNLYLNNAADEWLAQVFETWLSNEKFHHIKIPIFDNIIRRLLGISSHICNIGKGSCIGNLIGILPDGRAYHCDKFFHDEFYKLGNINFDSFETILRSAQINLIEKQNGEAIDNLDCKWKEICRGGCPFIRYSFTHYRGSKKPGCCGHQILYDRIHDVLTKYYPDSVKNPCQSLEVSYKATDSL